MIKTTELMLGNLIEFGGSYMVVTALNNEKITCGTVCERAEHFNPIPLTERVLKRLCLAVGDDDYVHELQNYATVKGIKPIDITPLLSPRYTTHDGVEVWEGDKVWYVEKDAQKDFIPHPYISGVRYDGCYYFSTQQASQSYIDKVTRKPIFTTEDGVDVFEGDEYYATSISGYDKYGYEAIVDKIKVPKVWEGDDTKVRFANKETAKKYLQWVLTKSQAEKAEKEYNDLLNAKK